MKKIHVVFWMVVRGVEELPELRIRDRVPVNEERSDLQGVPVKASGRILPWILHVHSRRLRIRNPQREFSPCRAARSIQDRSAGWERFAAAGASTHASN